MAQTKQTKTTNKCVMRVQSRKLNGSYTKVKLMPENYDRCQLVASLTGDTLQNVTDRLISYALDNCVIVDDNGEQISVEI